MPNLLFCEHYASNWQMNKPYPEIILQRDLCSCNIINRHAFEVYPISLGQMTIYILNTVHSYL